MTVATTKRWLGSGTKQVNNAVWISHSDPSTKHRQNLLTVGPFINLQYILQWYGGGWGCEDFFLLSVVSEVQVTSLFIFSDHMCTVKSNKVHKYEYFIYSS